MITSIGEMLDCNSGYTEDALSNFSFVSYEMSNLSSNIQSWISKLRLKHLYHKCFLGKERNRLKIVAIFEEAKMLFSEGLHKGSTSVDYIKQLITQARASGFGAIVTDQNKNELADFVLNNLSCQICFNLASPKEARVTGYSLGCNEEQVRQIHYLKIPNAIISISGHAPFMIKIPKSSITKHIPDNELKDLILPRLAGLTSTVRQKPQKLKIQLAENKEDKGKGQSVKGFLGGFRNFLIQIKKYPELNISQLYHSLNLSGRKGDKIKKQLLDNSLIQEEIIHTGKRKRPSKQLKITERGDRLLQWLEKKVKAA